MANPIRKMTPTENFVYSACPGYKDARLISWREASYEGTWKEGTRNSGQFHDGTVETATVGNKVTVSFYGKAIGLYGLRGRSHAVLKCYLDGVPQSNKISTYLGSQSLMSANTSYVVADEVGYHTVTFETESFSDEEAFLAFGYFIVY